MGLLQKFNTARRLLKLLRELYGPILDLPTISDVDSHLARYRAASLGLVNSVSLDIGCGDNPRNPFHADKVFGLDVRENLGANVRSADLASESIPFPDQTFDFISAFDFLEHVPRVGNSPDRRFPFVELMNEVWRTLKPGGLFLSHTPIFPFGPVFRDPTHINIMTVETMPMYFDNKRRWASIYGFHGAFEIIDQSLRQFWLVSLLKKSA